MMTFQTIRSNFFSLSLWSISALLVLSFLSMMAATTNVYADHIAAAQDRNFQEYCVNYQYTGQTLNPLNVQCESTRQACDQRLAEYEAREDLEPTSDCYKADVGRLATVYCVDYQYTSSGGTGEQCERSIEACQQRLAEYEAREDLDVTSDGCYKHEKQYVNFSEHPYLRQYQR
jgi:hypothetical protein